MFGDLVQRLSGSQSGPVAAVILLLTFCSLLLGGRLYVRREIDYRDALIARQDERLTRQQDLFDQALELLREQLRRP